MAEKLTKYRDKRNFEKTAEPSGTVKIKKAKREQKQILKFVVQYHLARKTHYDFRLEWQGVLLSWAVPKGPSYNPADKRLAVRVEDHPLEYADFEGSIPKGEYGGGTVMLWDEGTWATQTDFGEGLKKGSIKIVLRGKRLKGKWALVKLKAGTKETAENWLMIKERDEYAGDTDGIAKFKTGIRSGRTAVKIDKDENPVNKKNPFSRVDVQLAKLVDRVPSGGGWLYEVKYDGYRIVAFTEGGKTRLMTRTNHDFTEKFKTIAEKLGEWAAGRAMILDGETVVADEQGRTDFQALQHYVKKSDGKELTYMIFDLLALDGKDLRQLPLLERKKKLHGLLKDAPACLRFSDYVIGKGKESFAAAVKLNLEGIIGKRIDSVYSGDRSGDWIKIKCYKRQEFVVVGYSLSEKNSSGISSLLLGVYREGTLTYAGRAGTGIGGREAAELLGKFKQLKTEKPQLEGTPKARAGEKIFWLKPKLVAEIQFAEWTNAHQLRQASYKGLRADKPAKEVVLEIEPKSEKKVKKTTYGVKADKSETTVCGIKISSPDKIVFKTPEIKKLDVINYYAAVAERMLPYMGNRVLSVVRCHKGVSEACFFKKHPATESEGVKVIPIKNSEGDQDDYFYVENKTGIISEAQLGSIEFHVWGSRVNNLEKPDMMVFDLDPDEDMGLAQVRQGVRDLKTLLDELSLKSFLKTSGGKGYHIVVPFEPTVGWDVFHDFARRVAELMESRWPELYTGNIRKSKRKGKIFIDWVRNGRGATSVAPFSLRARPGACVSVPIGWNELDKVAPNGIGLTEAIARSKKSDPWKDFYKTGQKLKI